jgi:hypothetical protein
MGDFSHLKNKKGEFIHQPLPQPTLPNISIDDDLADIASLQKRAGSPSTSHTGGDKYYAADVKSSYEHPTMPAYNMPYSHVQDPNSHVRYNPSTATLPDESQYYDVDYGTTAHLALGAGPNGQQDMYDHSRQYHGTHGYVVDPYDVYTGHTARSHHDYSSSQYEHQPGQQDFTGQHSHNPPDDVGLAYDANPGYPTHHTGQQHWHLPPSSQYDGQFHAV